MTTAPGEAPFPDPEIHPSGDPIPVEEPGAEPIGDPTLDPRPES